MPHPAQDLHDRLKQAREMVEGGRLEVAGALLQGIAEDYPRAPQPHQALASLALRLGRSTAVRGHVEAARSRLGSKIHLPLELIDVDRMLLEGDGTAAAARLVWLTDTHPDRPGLWQTRARVADQAGRAEEALTCLERALALTGTAAMAQEIRRLQLILKVRGAEAADQALRTLRQGTEGCLQADLMSIALARSQGNMALILQRSEAAFQAWPDNPEILKAHVQALVDAGRRDTARTLLDRFLGADAVATDLLVLAARLARDAGDQNAESAILDQAINTVPEAPELFRYLLARHFNSGDPNQVAAILDTLDVRGRIPPRLKITAQLQMMDFASALESLRATGPVRDADKVLRISQALLGLHRIGLFLRYLRAGLRRYPGYPPLRRFAIMQLLQLGRRDQAQVLLETVAEGEFPEVERLFLVYQVAAHRRDFGAAKTAFDALKASRFVPRAERDPMTFLLFLTRDPWDGIPVLEDIHDDETDLTLSAERVSLIGQMKQEYRLEPLLAPDSRPPGGEAAVDLTAARARVRANPNLTRPALRLIDLWSASDMKGARFRGSNIPRRIIQYWNRTPRPAEVETLVDSWRRAPGFEHELHDRMSALRFLRSLGNTDTVQAFHMASNATEEADFFRLAMLAHRGGVWADADDLLYGDLEALLSGARGLWLYREAVLGSLGNNLMAAAPGHPILQAALEEARDALLQRSREVAWFKTGPGFLTRVAARVLAERNPPPEGLYLASFAEASAHVAMHRPALYKSRPGYWSRMMSDTANFWTRLGTALDVT